MNLIALVSAVAAAVGNVVKTLREISEEDENSGLAGAIHDHAQAVREVAGAVYDHADAVRQVMHAVRQGDNARGRGRECQDPDSQDQMWQAPALSTAQAADTGESQSNLSQ